MAKRIPDMSDARDRVERLDHTAILAASHIAGGLLPALGISASADQLRIVAQVSYQLAQMIVEEAGR